MTLDDIAFDRFEQSLYCPYCGEQVSIVVDPSEGSHSYIEDCFVCCRPMQVAVSVEVDGSVYVSATDENTV